MPDTSPETAPTTPPTSERHETPLAGQPGGFPSSKDYLPEGMNHRTATQWPNAKKQLKAFLEACDRANVKLVHLHSSRLPESLTYWWIRSWAGEFLFRTVEGINASVADVRALYEFGRKLDGLVGLTGTPPGARHPHNAEYTYYVEPLLLGGPDGRPVPNPFGQWREDYRTTEQNLPTLFPRRSESSKGIWLESEGFLRWGAFLATPDALTAQQREELGHVGYSESGTNGWCDFGSTFGEVWGMPAKWILDRLRDSIVIVSDSLRIGVQTVPQDLPFADALNLVSQWLVTAELLPLPVVPSADSEVAPAIASVKAKVEPETKGKPKTARNHPDKPGADRQANILTAIRTAGTPLTAPEIEVAIKLKTTGKLPGNLAWMMNADILINIPQLGYWPANQPVPK